VAVYVSASLQLRRAPLRFQLARLRHAKPQRGGARRDRTADLVNAIHALSQLSYGPFQVSMIRNQISDGAEANQRQQSFVGPRFTPATSDL
jgi:hypothetical protein